MMFLAKFAIYFAAGFCIMLGLIVTAYYLNFQMKKEKTISVSEFRSRLKKLLK